MIKDLVLKLINRVFFLELPERNGLEKNLLKKFREQNFKAAILFIESLSKSMENINNVRRKIAHGEGYEHSDLGLIEANDFLSNSPYHTDVHNTDKKRRAFYKEITKGVVMLHLHSMDKNEKLIRGYLINLFAFLYRVRRHFEKEFKKMK
jgi:hypothetical protein